MKIDQRLWSIRDLVKCQSEINLNPSWQRGPAWREPRQALLIDSILRGMDIPKIYLRRLASGGSHRFEAVDGQQRLRAIWMFAEGALALRHPEPLSPVGRIPIASRHFAELPKRLRDSFMNFTVSVAEIIQGNNNEVAHLFSRLQMGVPLNPAELRNAMLGPMRHTIDTVAMSHIFFTESRIPTARYKRQDYATHIFAMAAYGGSRDIKAPTLKALMTEFGLGQIDRILDFSDKVGDALNVLADLNRLVGFRITQKWIFVDLCWLVMQHQAAGRVMDPEKLAAAYLNFETLRRRHNNAPDELLRTRRVRALDRHLYNYILAFRTQGGTKDNLTTRNQALLAYFTDIVADE